MATLEIFAHRGPARSFRGEPASRRARSIIGFDEPGTSALVPSGAA